MNTNELQIDITKAVNNAYLRELQFKTHSEGIQNIIKNTNPQTNVDKTIDKFSIKFIQF